MDAMQTDSDDTLVNARRIILGAHISGYALKVSNTTKGNAEDVSRRTPQGYLKSVSGTLRRFRYGLWSLSILFAAGLVQGQETLVLFGTHGAGPEDGFSVGRFDPRTGTLSKPALVTKAAAPAYFVVAPGQKFLYTCNSPGFVSAYSIDTHGQLTFLNQMPSGGGDPSYISLDKTSRYVFAANYQGGSIAAWQIRPDGSLGERTAFIQNTGTSIDPVRQIHAFAHSIVVDPSNCFVLAADLGLDKVFVYKFDVHDGTLKPNDTPFVTVTPGSGPRHIVFHPNGRWVYLVNEMGSTIMRFRWDGERGTLSMEETVSTLPKDFYGVSTGAEIRINPNGKFLYASNRGHNSIAVFSIDLVTGRLSLVQDVPSGGKTPRNFDFDPSSKWLLVTNQDSDNALVFRVDSTTGLLTANGSPVYIRHPFSPRFLLTER